MKTLVFPVQWQTRSNTSTVASMFGYALSCLQKMPGQYKKPDFAELSHTVTYKRHKHPQATALECTHTWHHNWISDNLSTPTEQ